MSKIGTQNIRRGKDMGNEYEKEMKVKYNAPLLTTRFGGESISLEAEMLNDKTIINCIISDADETQSFAIVLNNHKVKEVLRFFANSVNPNL